MQNKAQSQAKRTRQSYISRREKQHESLGAEPPAAGGKRGFGSEAPHAVAIILLFSKQHTFLGIFWPKFMRKNTFLNG